MIHEEICTFEVCKLAKEKGFDEYEACSHLYEVDERWYTLTKYNNARGIDWSKSYFCVAPTQSLLQRWLREEKGLCISVEAYPTLAIMSKVCFAWVIKSGSDGHFMKSTDSLQTFYSYELALEDGLKYALEHFVKKKIMKNIIVVDIDGTISKVGDRIKYLQQDKKDWDSFYEHCDEDDVHIDIMTLVQTLYDDGYYDIVFCTGRRESCREKTAKWLAKYSNINEYTLIMRPNYDFRHDTEVKPELLKEYNITPDRVLFILEDRDSMVAKWRELGYRCLQVAEGNF